MSTQDWKLARYMLRKIGESASPAEGASMLTDEERKSAEALIQGHGLYVREVQAVGQAALRLDAELSAMNAELLRVRTTGHGAAHALDNLCVEFGIGAGLAPMRAADAIRAEFAVTEGAAQSYEELLCDKEAELSAARQIIAAVEQMADEVTAETDCVGCQQAMLNLHSILRPQKEPA